MTSNQHTVNDFHIGESVVPLRMSELTFVITDIDKERELIICPLPDLPEIIFKFKPTQIEKEIFFRPPNIVDLKFHRANR